MTIIFLYFNTGCNCVIPLHFTEIFGQAMIPISSETIPVKKYCNEKQLIAINTKNTVINQSDIFMPNDAAPLAVL